MNRLSPLIVRRAPPRTASAAAQIRQPPRWTDDGPAEWLDDLRLFATGWVGGLIFFGTLIG